MKEQPVLPERLLRSDNSRHQNREIVRHLLTRHRAGAAATSGAEAPSTPASAAGLYDRVFNGLSSRTGEAVGRLAAERREAARQWSALERHPHERRLMKVRNDERLQTWGFYELLLERSRELAPRDPAAAAEHAELAVTVAEALDAERYGAERVADFRAAALTALGNARRLAADVPGAEAAARQAHEALDDGTGDRLEQADLLSLRSALCVSTGDLGESARLLHRAIGLYRLVGQDADPHPADLFGTLLKAAKPDVEQRDRKAGSKPA